MPTFAVRSSHDLTAKNTAGVLIPVPHANEVLILKDGDIATVYSSRTKAAMPNPVPIGVAPGTPGLDTLGNLVVYRDPGDGYSARVTVGTTVTTVALAGVPMDPEEPIAPAAVSEAMLAFGVATQAELDAVAEEAARIGASDATKASDAAVVHLAGPETLTGAKTFKGVEPVVIRTDADTRVAQWIARHAVGTGDQHRVELFPPMDNGRIALTMWATQEKTDADRMVSIEAHGMAEGQSQNPNADNHVTIYSVKQDNTVTKMIEWTWGSQWDGILKLLHSARVFGTLEVSGASGLRLFNNVALNAFDSGSVSRRLLVLTPGNNMTVGDVDNGMNMSLTLKAGGTGQIQLQTANTNRLTLTANFATFTIPVVTVASAAGGAGVRLPHGTAPTAPSNGDMWTTTAGLFVRINGATIGPLT